MRWIAVLLLLAGAALAADPLVVATKEAPPFAIKNSDGTWSGLTIDLLEVIAGSLGRDPEYREYDLDGMLAAVESGEAEIAAAAISITPDREKRLDFTHPYHMTGFAIAARAESKEGDFPLLRALTSSAFLRPVGLLLTVLLVAGLLVWLFERRRNHEQFGGSPARGIGSGFWWSAVTMTTVGYGDKAPRTAGGRVVGFVWMFISLIVVATLTGAIASSLTVASLDSGITGPDDLRGLTVAAIRGSSSEAYLARRSIRVLAVDDVEGGLGAVADKRAGAMVHDRPILLYALAQRQDSRLQLLPSVFKKQAYSFAVGQGTQLREEFNRAMLSLADDDRWERIKATYLPD
jgi:ABC-type amino acid transport substrate-binding protein